MAHSYSDAATSDDLSAPLLHRNGMEKEETHDIVLDIGESNDQTRNRGSEKGKEKEDESNDQTCNRGNNNEKGQTVDKSTHRNDRKRNFHKPILVSIGPKYAFSKEDAQVKKEKEYKDKYFKSFLKRGMEHLETTNQHEEEYPKYLKELKLMEKAQKYYKDIGISCPSSYDEKMLVTDSCFVVEFVLKCKEGGNGDPRINDDGKNARKDMLLFENQVPFEILTTLYEKMIGRCTEVEPKFIRLVKFAFASLAPNITLSNFFDDKKPEQPMDILHVVYSLCLPINGAQKVTQDENDEWPTALHINSATELREVGVSFNNTGKVYTMPRQYEKTEKLHKKISTLKERDDTSLFDITFSGGVMNIPSFKVDDSTEIFFRNMIALELRCRMTPKYYTDYARLMDHLVDTDKDVSLLRKKGTIHNLSGEDRKVANMFNNFCVKVDISTNFYFASVYTAVNGHCRNRRLVWMAKLKNDYFSNPWKGISTVVGVIILLLGAALSLKSLLTST